MDKEGVTAEVEMEAGLMGSVCLLSASCHVGSCFPLNGGSESLKGEEGMNGLLGRCER